MTQPPNVPPPPPPPGYGTPPGYAPPAPTYVPAGYQPPAGYAVPPGAMQPAHGKVSPTRLILVFVIVLAIGLAVGAAVVLAVAPGPKKPDCPDPAVSCGQPPVAPTLPPIANASHPPITPAPTIVRPSGSLVVPSARPSVAPTPGISSATPSGQPSAPATAAPPATAPPASQPPIANLPQPQQATNADALHTGTVWTSSALGFRLEYDDTIWSVQKTTDSALELSAGQGSVLVVIEGFKASSSPKSLVAEKVRAIADQVLGLTEESDPSRQLPGQPVVGHRQGVGSVLNGTIDQPQGPQANVDVVVLAASDNQISIRLTLLTSDDLREAAFAVVDSINNSIEWPSEQ